jgi:hypothetical protein
METICMRRNKTLSILPIALAFACGIGHAAGAEVCAAKSQALRSVTVFDGPPAEQASLVPDQEGKSGSSWELGYVYDAGRTVWVRCQYADGTSADVQLSAKVGKCEYKAVKKNEIKLSCQ